MNGAESPSGRGPGTAGDPNGRLCWPHHPHSPHYCSAQPKCVFESLWTIRSVLSWVKWHKRDHHHKKKREREREITTTNKSIRIKLFTTRGSRWTSYRFLGNQCKVSQQELKHSHPSVYGSRGSMGQSRLWDQTLKIPKSMVCGHTSPSYKWK